MKKLALHWQVIIGLLLGVVYAWLSVTMGWNDFTLAYIQPFGDIFINLLKLIAVPLVLFSIISGVTSLGNIQKLGRMGIKTLLTYVATTMAAVVIGLALVNVFQPGSGADDDLLKANRIRYELWRDANGIQALDDIRTIDDPANAALVQSIASEEAASSEWVTDKLNKATNTKNSGPLQPLVDVVPKNIFSSLVDMSMLQIIFFAIFFGIVVVGLPDEKKAPLTRAVDSLNEVFVQMVWVVMKAMPFFVFALMAGQIVKAAGTEPEMLKQLLSFLPALWLGGGPRIGHHGLPLLPRAGGFDDQEIELEAIPIGHARCAADRVFNVKFSGHAPGHHAMRSRPVGREHAHLVVCPAHRRHGEHGRHQHVPGHCGGGLSPVPHGRLGL